MPVEGDGRLCEWEMWRSVIDSSTCALTRGEEETGVLFVWVRRVLGEVAEQAERIILHGKKLVEFSSILLAW